LGRPRFFCDSICRGTVELAGVEAHHLADVLRLSVGEKVELFDGAGTLAAAVVSEVKKKKVLLRTETIKRQMPRQSGRIIIASSVAKGERFDWLVGKCTEIGVDRIVGVLFERTVKTAGSSSAAERYRRLAISAAKQCGRVVLPGIEAAVGFEDCLGRLRSDYPDGRFLYGGRGIEACWLSKVKYTGSDTVAFVGPEGGLSDRERRLLAEYKAEPVRLTETVLRVETAAMAFAAILAGRRDGFDAG